MSKQTFILHVDKLDIINDFTYEERGRLFTAIYEYQKNGTIPSKDFLKESYYLFKGSFVPQFEADKKKYAEMIERNRINGTKNKKNTNTSVSTQSLPVGTNGSQSMPVEASGSLTDTVTVTETVTENDFNKKIHSSSFYVEQKKEEEDFIKNDCEGVIQDFKIDLDVDGKKPDKTPPDSLFDLEPPREPKKRKRASKGDPRKKQHYIPDDFELTDDLANFAFENADRFEINWDINMIRLEFDKFKSHYKNADGYAARKLDWSEAFKSWILKAISYKVDAKNNKPVFYTNQTPGKQDQTPGKQGKENTLEVLNQATKDNPWGLLNQATSDKYQWAIVTQAF